MNYVAVAILGLAALNLSLRLYSRFHRRKLTAAQRQVMTTYATYYQQLDPASQLRFERTVADFVNRKSGEVQALPLWTG
jgi:hypothetical protein